MQVKLLDSDRGKSRWGSPLDRREPILPLPHRKSRNGDPLVTHSAIAWKLRIWLPSRMLPSRFFLSKLYLILVCAIYALIGGFGVIGGFPAGPFMGSLFLTSDPYPLLHALNAIAGISSSSLMDSTPGLNPTALQAHEFVRNSSIILVFALVGVLAAISAARWAKHLLHVLISLSSLAAIWNWIAYFVHARNVGPFLQIWILIPIISTVWCVSYWVAFRALENPSLVGSLSPKFKVK